MRPLLPALAFALLSTSALAQTESASDARFQIERSGDAFIRLDRQTGAVSTCVLSNGELDCRSSADERAALQAEIDRLSEEVEQLKSGSVEAKTGFSKDGKELTLKLPTEAEIKQVVAFFEDMVRRVVDAVKDLARDA